MPPTRSGVQVSGRGCRNRSKSSAAGGLVRSARVTLRGGAVACSRRTVSVRKLRKKAAEFRKNLYFCMIICKIKTQRYEYFV